MSNEVDLFLPNAGPPQYIRRGSGIAGRREGERLSIYYEGNLYGSESFKTFADRCLHAADRMLARYPTIACAWVEPDSVQHIGVIEMLFGEVKLAEGVEPLLAAWLDVEHVDPAELVTTDRRAERRTVRDHWSAAQREQLRHLPFSQRQYYRDAGLI